MMTEKELEKLSEFIEEFMLAYEYEIDKKVLMWAIARAYQTDEMGSAKLLRLYCKGNNIPITRFIL